MESIRRAIELLIVCHGVAIIALAVWVYVLQARVNKLERKDN